MRSTSWCRTRSSSTAASSTGPSTIRSGACTCPSAWPTARRRNWCARPALRPRPGVGGRARGRDAQDAGVAGRLRRQLGQLRAHRLGQPAADHPPGVDACQADVGAGRRTGRARHRDPVPAARPACAQRARCRCSFSAAGKTANRTATMPNAQTTALQRVVRDQAVQQPGQHDHEQRRARRARSRRTCSRRHSSPAGWSGSPSASRSTGCSRTAPRARRVRAARPSSAPVRSTSGVPMAAAALFDTKLVSRPISAISSASTQGAPSPRGLRGQLLRRARRWHR